MSHDDVLFGYRLRLFTLAEEIGVRPACRAMGVAPRDRVLARIGQRTIREAITDPKR